VRPARPMMSICALRRASSAPGEFWSGIGAGGLTSGTTVGAAIDTGAVRLWRENTTHARLFFMCVFFYTRRCSGCCCGAWPRSWRFTAALPSDSAHDHRVALAGRSAEALAQFVLAFDQDAAGRDFVGRRREVGAEFRIGRQRYRRAAFLVRVEFFAELPPGFGALLLAKPSWPSLLLTCDAPAPLNGA
jgi:hypothetical protein